MDGRGRLLRSLTALNFGFAPAVMSYAGALLVPETLTVRPEVVLPVRQPKRGLLDKILSRLARPGTSAWFSLALLMAVGVYGAVRGGHYATFVAKEGEPGDIIARALGFSIKAVTIAGERELKEQDILAVAGIGPRNSLLFLDAEKIRERLKQLPLVKEATVTKFYPDRLLIEIEERQPFALWQSDGNIHLVAADGVPLARVRDRRFIHLPFVVGPGANEKLDQYLAFLEAAGDLRERIVSGVRVARRRWTLKTENGTDILLPETEPEEALSRLADLQRAYHVLDKDIISLDLRQPGRLIVRLSEDAAAARAAALARKTTKTKGTRR
jgi:cell division protein FtsQ